MTKTTFKPTLAFAICLLISFGCLGQADLVKTEGLTNDLHRLNLGRIIFTVTPRVRLEDLKAEDFLSSIQLSNKSNLGFRAFLRTSLTNYLHKLAPRLTAEELTQQGNYQFTFSVDGVSIYQENLHPAAVRSEVKNAQTTFSLSLIDSADPESGRIWKRFLFNGGDQALTPGTHLLGMELRPYIKTTETKVGELIAAGELRVTILPTERIDRNLIAVQPITANSGWKLSKATYDNSKIEELNRKIAEGFYKEIKTIVVLNEGELLIEEYFGGATRDSLHDTRSVGKSFVSPLVGIAINDGYIKNEEQTLKDFYELHKFDNYSQKKQNVTIKSLLTMSSAFDGNDDDPGSPGNEEKMYPTTDWVKFALDLPMDEKKAVGEKWAYFTAGVVVLGDILTKSVPEGLEKYADKKLFQPLGIRKYEWQFTPQKVPNTAGGLRMSALDFAKFGQLYKNGGQWNGKQVIPIAWLEKTFSRQQKVPYGDNVYYGYLFWNTTFNVKGKPYEAFFATGNGGNKIFVFKDHPWVIVITATAYAKWYMHAQVNNMMESYILPALIK